VHGSAPKPPAELRLPRRARLLSRGQFDRVFKQGRKVVERRLVVWMIASPEGMTTSRVGFSVSRKVGNAVQRNRVKRVLREAFRRSTHTISPPMDMVILARPANPPTTLDEARASLDRVLSRWRERAPRGDATPPAS
jgi:ribonuclease P protein component